MALEKNVELKNGVVMNYHRIASLNKITNISNNIEINSYISVDQREKEKTYQELQRKSAMEEKLTAEELEALEKGINVLVESGFVVIPYDEKMTIESAYAYLKTTEKFQDAEDK